MYLLFLTRVLLEELLGQAERNSMSMNIVGRDNQIRGLLGADVTRRNGVDTNTLAAEFTCQGASHLDNGLLRFVMSNDFFHVLTDCQRHTALEESAGTASDDSSEQIAI